MKNSQQPLKHFCLNVADTSVKADILGINNSLPQCVFGQYEVSRLSWFIHHLSKASELWVENQDSLSEQERDLGRILNDLVTAIVDDVQTLKINLRYLQIFKIVF